MYLTFYVNAAPKQLTWEDILNNPYLTAETKAEKKKITKEIPTEYADRLWEKRAQPYTFPTLPEGYDTSKHYRHFQIPKKSNPHKMRQIDAPDEELSTYQGLYKSYIEDWLQVLPHKAAHAYVKERSTVTAMQMHQKNESKWFLQIDLKDFFNSITGEWLKDQLLMVFPFKYIEPNVLNDLITVSLLNGVLPQGSKLSPLLTNLAMVPIDYMITERLHNWNNHHYVYTRYADDITISCKEKFNPQNIIDQIMAVFEAFCVPFRINNEKTRFGSIAGRNYHLGIILNKDNKLSVGHEKNNKFRAQVNNFCLVGEEWDRHDIQKFLGIISYYKAIEPEFIEKTLEKYGEKYGINIIAKAKELIK